LVLAHAAVSVVSERIDYTFGLASITCLETLVRWLLGHGVTFARVATVVPW